MPKKGYKQTDSHLKKLIEVRRSRKPWNYRKPLSEKHCENIAMAHLGKILSKETRQKIGDSHRGERCYRWKGGISFEPYCVKFNRSFKNRVRAFFGHKCVECGTIREENGRKLDVHHVNYNKMVCCNDVKPLFVALCRSHNIMANTNREFWEDWYTEIINEFYGGICYLPKV